MKILVRICRVWLGLTCAMFLYWLIADPSYSEAHAIGDRMLVKFSDRLMSFMLGVAGCAVAFYEIAHVIRHWKARP